MSEFNQILENQAEYSYNFPRCQNFLLPVPIIRYITERPSSSALGYRKLQQTCKYFFAKKKIILLDKDWVGKNEVIQYASKFAAVSSGGEKVIFWLINGLCSCAQTLSFQEFTKAIYRFDIHELVFSYQNFTLDELNILLSGGKITYLSLWQTNIHDSQGNPATVDTILSKVPKAINIWYGNQCETYTLKTFEKLNALKFFEKFDRFYLDIPKVTNDINPWILYKFIQKNSRYSSSFCIDFPSTLNETYQKYLNIISDISDSRVKVYFEA